MSHLIFLNKLASRQVNNAKAFFWITIFYVRNFIFDFVGLYRHARFRRIFVENAILRETLVRYRSLSVPEISVLNALKKIVNGKRYGSR